MPKNKKPAGGRPAKNFDPRYAKKSSHRGQGGPASGGKNRWNDDDRAGRTSARDISRGARDSRGQAGDERGGRPQRDDQRGYRGQDDRRGGQRDFRGQRDDQRGYRSQGDDRRGGRSFDGGRDERGTRHDRAANDRRHERFESNRSGARFDRDQRRRDADRADRGFEGRTDNRGDRGFGDRGDRGFGRDDKRSFGGDRRDGGRGSYRDDNRSSGGDRRFGRDDNRSSGGDRRFGRDDNSGDRRDGGRGSYRDDNRFSGGDRRFGRDHNRGDRRDGGRGSFGGDNRFSGGDRRDGGRGSFGNDGRSFGGDRRFGSDDSRGDRRDGGRGSFGNDGRSFGGDRRSDNRGDRRDGGRGSFGNDGRSFGGDRRDDNRSFGGDRRSDNRGDRRDGGRGSFGGDRPVRDERRSSGPRFDDRSTGARRENAGERAWREHRDAQQAPQRSVAQEQRIDIVHERLEAQAVEATDTEGVTFASLGFGDNIVRALAALGAETPFPIQASTAPAILDGRDVLARGRTGSGKTIAFGAPLVERILRSQKGTKREYGRAPVALILAPTRELALQIDRTVQPIARSVGLFTTQIYGGVPQGRQVGALRKGVDIVIGTPGRIEDLQKQGKLDLSQVRTSVIDEADHMCELGFLEPVQRILRLTEAGGQKLLFSATLDREVASLVEEFLRNPAVYEVAGENQETGTIDHRVLVVEHRRKPEILEQLVTREGRTLVFTRTRAYAEMLAEQFDEAGIKAIALHGDLTQVKRTRNIERFSKGKAQVLVATDVAARGIHVDDVDLVVQADAPDEYKTYLHRAGRTGRAGNTGRVVTLIPRGRKRRMEELLERAEIDAPFDEAAPGDELLDELAGAPTVADLTS